MSIHDDHLLDALEQDEERDEPTTHICKYCREPGLTWTEVEDGQWRLMHKNGRLHSCPRTQMEI